MVEGRTIEFKVNGGKSKGYLVAPTSDNLKPGLIVIHEWWGLNDHIKDVAWRLASEGYVVLAPDLYSGKTTKDPDEAGRLMQELDENVGLAILMGAIKYLKDQDSVQGESIGVTGFCMGGSYALLLACHSKDIKAAVAFYGDVPPDDVLAKLEAPVLFIGAENDLWITKDKMARLSEALDRLRNAGEVKVYSGVGHAFFNDTRAEAYDLNAAQDAWKRVVSFFDKYLK